MNNSSSISGERLQKVLARAGFGSRRQIETWIEAGRIQLNRQPASLGDRIKPDDRIRIDGRDYIVTAANARTRVLIYHKPEGEICTRSDPEGRPTVFANLPQIKRGRWLSIGRLDVNTAGLLLVTTNGELANRLAHPRQAWEREYAVRVHGEPTALQSQALLQGVVLEDGPARFESLQSAGGEGRNRWYHVVLKEGRKREVRRLWESQGLQVSRLIRIRFGELLLPRDLRQGQYRELNQQAVAQLMSQAGLRSQAGEVGDELQLQSARPARRSR